MNPYMYIFVRKDISIPQQIVQAAHAVDELNKKHLHEPGNYMVLCDAEDEASLLKVSEWLCHHDIKHEMFYEPDLNSYTAIATKPLRGAERQPLKKFKTYCARASMV